MSSRKGAFTPGDNGPWPRRKSDSGPLLGILSRFCLQEPMVNAYLIETVSRSHNRHTANRAWVSESGVILAQYLRQANEV